MTKASKGALEAIFNRKASWPVKTLRTALLTVTVGFFAIPTAFETLSSRPMTDDEISHYKPYFGDAIDYSKVRIHHSAAGDFLLKYDNAAAITMRNAIILPEKNYNDSSSTPYNRYIMAHELGHIWQHQTRLTISFFQASWQKVNNLINDKDKTPLYEYTLKSNKKLKDFRIEQQASIIADYYNIRNGSWPEYLTDYPIIGPDPEAKNREKLYQHTLEKFLKQRGSAPLPDKRAKVYSYSASDLGIFDWNLVPSPYTYKDILDYGLIDERHVTENSNPERRTDLDDRGSQRPPKP